MRPTLQEQLGYLTRIVNPDYIIIVKHKAKENMDFSQFRVVTKEIKEPYKPQKRYEIKVKEQGFGMLIITVEDIFMLREIYRVTCKEEKLEANMKVITQMYRGSDIQDKI